MFKQQALPLPSITNAIVNYPATFSKPQLLLFSTAIFSKSNIFKRMLMIPTQKYRLID